MGLSGIVNISFGSAYLCAEYELRVTRRCLDEDLQNATSAPFDDLKKHEIIKALIKRRRDGPDDTKMVSPLPGGLEVYRLAYGDRHRGATWYDEDNRVVWLVAYAQHEFEAAGDAFPYFKQLCGDGRLLPDEVDYQALFADRSSRFAGVARHDATLLLAAARADPGTEQRGFVGGEVGVGIAVEIVETLTETYLAIKIHGLGTETLPILLAAFFPEYDFADIESTNELPSRPLDSDELGFRALSE
ncbi:MAG: hypothetical protein ACR2QA_17835 [Solirubrobacteraceae bacterium]